MVLEIGLNCVVKLVNERGINVVTLDLHGLSQGSVQGDEALQDFMGHGEILPHVLLNALQACLELGLSLGYLRSEPLLNCFFKLMRLEHRELTESTNSNKGLINLEEDLVNVEAGVETTPRGVLLTKTEDNLTSTHGGVKANFLDCASAGVLDHAGSLEFEFMSLYDDLIIVENGLKCLHLAPLHVADGSDSHLDISHGGLELIKSHILLLPLLDLFHQQAEVLGESVHYNVSVHSHLQMGLKR